MRVVAYAAYWLTVATAADDREQIERARDVYYRAMEAVCIIGESFWPWSAIGPLQNAALHGDLDLFEHAYRKALEVGVF